MTNVVGIPFQFHVRTHHQTSTAHAGLVRRRIFIEHLGLPDFPQLHFTERERGDRQSDNVLALCWNLILGGDS